MANYFVIRLEMSKSAQWQIMGAMEVCRASWKPDNDQGRGWTKTLTCS